MAEPKNAESLPDVGGQALAEIGVEDPKLVVVDDGLPNSALTSPFGRQFPDRFFRVGGIEAPIVPRAAELASEGRTVVASTSDLFAAGSAYHLVRRALGQDRANVKIVATHGSGRVGEPVGSPPMVDDIGLMRGLPGMTVVVPSDGPTTRAAMRAVVGFSGPAYVRLTREELPTVTDGSFQIGKAATLREGSDLTVIAVGAFVPRALDVAQELGRVGVSVRVLDFASVKPFDEKALLRAARETGAILTMEEHSVLTGVGALVASATAEEAPVPVRRVGVPDMFLAPGEAGSLRDRYGMSKERCLEEAWTLLKARGKVQ